MPISIRLLLIAIVMPLLASGCAFLSPDFMEPEVEVTSITLQNANGLSLGFDIGLRVSNPNRDALNIDGLTYTLYLAGKKVVTGVGSELPSIPAYGVGEYKLKAVLSLFTGLGLLNDLTNENSDSIEYELITKFDLGQYYPEITTKEKGVFNF